MSRPTPDGTAIRAKALTTLRKVPGRARPISGSGSKLK